MKHFALHTIYTLTTEKGAITPEGKRLITALINNTNRLSPEWKELNPDNGYIKLPDLPDVDGFSWFWIVQTGEYRGTFPKRVARWYKKNHGIICPKAFIEKVGNLARSHSLEAYTYQFDFTDRFNWHSGDYGDDGSCYWGSNEEARELLEENGGLAIRFIDEENDGYARAWVYPTDDFYIVFNGYGMTTLEIAKIFATWLGADYKKIKLYNNHETSGLIYINGNGIGYAVGEADKINTSQYDLEIYTPNACERCGRDMGEDYYTTPDGEHYCQDCFYNVYEYCYHCDGTYSRDDVTYVESVERDVCDSCLNRHYGYCDYCDNHYSSSEMSEGKGGLAICSNCRENQ